MPQLKFGTKLELGKIKVDIEDKSSMSTSYFLISALSIDCGLGKNSFTVNNTPKDMRVEILDSSLQVLYYEKANNTDYVNKTKSTVISFHVYPQTQSGVGKIIIVGTIDNKLVRYTQIINIDTSIYTDSKVRFYSIPSLEVSSLLSYSTLVDVNDVNPKTVTGSFYGTAIYPRENFDIDNGIYNKYYTDYRITSTNSSFSSSFKNFLIKLNVATTTGDVTESILIKNVINSSTLQLAIPFSSPATPNNKPYVSNISSGQYEILYSDYRYTSSFFSTASYIRDSSDLAGATQYRRYSIAEVLYRNLETFSGNVVGHNLYRRSLNIASEYALILSEKFSENELLKVYNSPIKSYENIGNFYTQFHINNFWFTSSNSFSLVQDSSVYIDGMKITGSMSGYCIAKLNTSTLNRNSSYIAYNEDENTNQSGSAYDCNFIKLIKDTEYIVSFNCSLLSKAATDVALLDFYITGSYTKNVFEPIYDSRYGIHVADLNIGSGATEKNFGNPIEFKFVPKNDIYGTLIIVPSGFTSLVINNLSIKPNKVPGFSPSSYTTRVLFPVNQANELFDIKSELIDNNGNVVYSALRTIQHFDPEGLSSSPTFYSGMSISASNVIISGDLKLGSLSNWGLLEAGDRILGIDPVTDEVGYYIAPNLSSGSADFAISASYSLTASFASDAVIWHTAPTSSIQYGLEGWMAYDGDYHYIYAGSKWYRQAISEF